MYQSHISDRTRALVSTIDDNDHDSLHSVESDDEGIHTPQHHLNPIQDYLNSSPLDHGPPELSTISEQYGDPSSPSQRASAIKYQQKVSNDISTCYADMYASLTPASLSSYRLYHPC
jgi:hypothetical protein